MSVCSLLTLIIMTQNTISNNKSLAKNTLYLYLRTFITMIVGLYASRIVLQVLGASDFGLYNVVGGVLTMFTMISSALQVGTQRFLSFALGESDDEKLKKIFSIALGLHFIVAILVLALAETIGLWFLNNYLNIPDGREQAALYVYQFTIFGFMFSFIQVPFQSCLIAHEKMSIYAYMSIYDAVMKLAIVIVLPFLTIDKLVAYGALLLLLHFSTVLIYNIYCRKNFSECVFSISFDKNLTREIVYYSGWNIFGGSVNLFANQGINILLNIFYGTIVNAARGLTVTVSNILFQFITSFQMAADPQIIKLYAAKELDKFHRLLINSCRIATYLYFLVAIPVFLEINFILKFWLGEYPTYTNVFIRIILIELYFKTVNQPILYSIHASGKMKWQNIVCSTLLYMMFPCNWIVLEYGCTPEMVFIISALFWGINNIGCLVFSNKYTGLSIRDVIIKVYGNTILGGSIMLLIPYLVSINVTEGWMGFIIVCSVSIICSIVVIYYWGITDGMRQLLKEKLYK